ncbi:hypothetical protein DFH11DRAFT_248811 [Phellopilus nigrolimitatus]|nr:hypothetical protein DFH11DRAFT_248811 [Phellopilus nigrolimitatus]
MALPITQSAGKTSLLSLPDEILLKIFSEFSFSNWATDNSERTRGPWNPFLLDCYRRERANCSNLPTKFSLALVSKLFHALTKGLPYEFVRIRSARGLCGLRDALRDSSDLESNLARYTRRMDIMLIEEPSTFDLIHRDPQIAPYHPLRDLASLYIVAKAVLRRCTSLTHLTVCMTDEDTCYGRSFGRTVAETCPSLQVLNWRFASEIRLAPLLLNLAAQLRVLEISTVALFIRRSKIGAVEMPHLHTVKGPIDVLIISLNGMGLPSLTTIIAELPEESTFFPDYKYLANEFFERYGRQITTFASWCSEILVDLTTMPNLRELAFHMSDSRLLSTRGSVMSKLTHIGIVYTHSRRDSGSYVIGICEKILDDRDTAFPALKTMQLLHEVPSRNMRQDVFVCHRLLEKFRTTGIRFLDHLGNLFKPGHTEYKYKRSDMSGKYVKCGTKQISVSSSTTLRRSLPGSSSGASLRSSDHNRSNRTLRGSPKAGDKQRSTPIASDICGPEQSFDFKMKLTD